MFPFFFLCLVIFAGIWPLKKTATSLSLYGLASYKGRPHWSALWKNLETSPAFSGNHLLWACVYNFPIREVCWFLSFSELIITCSVWHLCSTVGFLMQQQATNLSFLFSVALRHPNYASPQPVLWIRPSMSGSPLKSQSVGHNFHSSFSFLKEKLQVGCFFLITLSYARESQSKVNCNSSVLPISMRLFLALCLPGIWWLFYWFLGFS